MSNLEHILVRFLWKNTFRRSLWKTFVYVYVKKKNVDMGLRNQLWVKVIIPGPWVEIISSHAENLMSTRLINAYWYLQNVKLKKNVNVWMWKLKSSSCDVSWTFVGNCLAPCWNVSVNRAGRREAGETLWWHKLSSTVGSGFWPLDPRSL